MKTTGVIAVSGVRVVGEPTWRDDAAPLLMALLALMAWDALGLDLPLARAFGSAQGFAWREHWLTSSVMHGGVRNAAWVLFAALVVGIRFPLPMLRTLSRRERWWWLGTTLLCIALIPLLKRASWTSCPWSLAEFGGGSARYVPHWLLGQRDGGPGGCFPSGHASTAFGFLAGWYVLRRTAPGLARAWLVATVASGLTLGWVQMMRGAHYASHTLWTAWICWAITMSSYHVFRSWHEGDVAHRDRS